MRRFWVWTFPAIIFFFWIGWAWMIFGPFPEILGGEIKGNRYVVAGTLGDAFGVVSSLMATVAAIAVFYSYKAQRDDADLQYFERNFFTLLSNFRDIVNEIDLTRRKRNDARGIPDSLRFAYGEIIAIHQGREALRLFLLLVRTKLKPENYKNSKVVHDVYCDQFNKFVDDLGHYFRSLYHIYKLIDEKCPRNKYDYARILRAHLSNSELCIIAYNCILSDGRFEFVKYIERYSVLHNLSREGLGPIEQAELNFFMRKLPDNCFRFDPIKKYTY